MPPAFVETLARGGTDPALVFPGGRAVSYVELAERVDVQAQRLGKRKRLVAIEARPSEEVIVAYLGALVGGHAVAMLPPDDAAAARRADEALEPDVRFHAVGGRWRVERAGDARPGSLHPDLALLLSTSGSTGNSRFVRLSTGNLGANAAAIAEFLGLERGDRAALVLPLHYCYGLSVLHSHLAAGASLYLPGKSIVDPGFLVDVREARCTNLSGVPYSFELLEQVGFRDAELPDLRFLTVAGGRLAPELVGRYHARLSGCGKRLFVMYGQTEATARMAFVPPDRLATNLDRIGIAIPGGELALVGEDGRTITTAETPGELVYRGPNVMMGYAAGRADLARGPEVAELRTGDLAERDRHGFYRIVGRLRRMSKIAGVRVGHDALEQALAARGIAAAVVGDDRTVLAVHTSRHAMEEVRRILVEVSGLAPFHVQARTVEALPRLPSGKVDYERLKGSLGEGSGATADGVRDLFREAFFPLDVEDDDSFVSLAGDSLRYVQLSAGLERLLGHIPEKWEHMPVRQLASLRRPRADTQVVGSDLILRALAVLLVVTHHATWWPIPGGAAAMVILIGVSLARFHGTALFAGDVMRLFRAATVVLVPYYLILAGYGIAWGDIPWASVFLVGNFGFADPDERQMLPLLYWFVEYYVQMMGVWAVLFLLPPVRRFARRTPFAFGLALLAAALAARFAGPALWPIGWREIFTLPWNFYLAVLGWCVVFADGTRKKLALLAVGAAVMPLMAYFGGNWTGAWVKFSLQEVCLAVLLFAPRVRLPRRAAALVLPVSVASYHIYLFHGFAPDLIRLAGGDAVPETVFPVLAIIGGAALGLLAHRVQSRLVLWLTRRRWSSAALPAPALAGADQRAGR